MDGRDHGMGTPPARRGLRRGLEPPGGRAGAATLERPPSTRAKGLGKGPWMRQDDDEDVDLVIDLVPHRTEHWGQPQPGRVLVTEPAPRHGLVAQGPPAVARSSRPYSRVLRQLRQRRQVGRLVFEEQPGAHSQRGVLRPFALCDYTDPRR